eukprot:15357223-Ditylum_brightwellii.AAC.1
MFISKGGAAEPSHHQANKPLTYPKINQQEQKKHKRPHPFSKGGHQATVKKRGQEAEIPPQINQRKQLRTFLNTT